MRLIGHPELRGRGRGLRLERGERQFTERWAEQMIGKQCLPCHVETMGHREEFDLQALPGSFQCSHTLSIFFVVTPGDSSLPGPGPLCRSFEAVEGELKVLPESFGP